MSAGKNRPAPSAASDPVLGPLTIANRIECALQPLELVEGALRARLDHDEYEVFTAPTLAVRQKLSELVDEIKVGARCARGECASVGAPTGQPHGTSAEVSDHRPETSGGHAHEEVERRVTPASASAPEQLSGVTEYLEGISEETARMRELLADMARTLYRLGLVPRTIEQEQVLRDSITRAALQLFEATTQIDSCVEVVSAVVEESATTPRTGSSGQP